MGDRLDITITESGLIRIDTGAISGINHASADKFLALLQELCGGEQTRVSHAHVYQGQAAHVHQGGSGE